MQKTYKDLLAEHQVCVAQIYVLQQLIAHVDEVRVSDDLPGVDSDVFENAVTGLRSFLETERLRLEKTLAEIEKTPVREEDKNA